MDKLVKWLGSNLDPLLRHSSTSLEFGIFFCRRRKNSASIIRAICTFDAKKVLEYRLQIVVTRFEKVS